MKKCVTQVRYIGGSDPWETADLFNNTMLELAELNPTYERVGDAYWVFYKVTTDMSERLHENTSERTAQCVDCPYSVRDLNRHGNIDARRKWGTCAKTGERIHIESAACEIYENLAGRRRYRR